MCVIEQKELEKTKKLLNWYKKKYFETLAANSQMAGNLAYYKWKDSNR